MTKKDYELIANEFKHKLSFVNHLGKNKDYQLGKYDAWWVLAQDMANTLGNENPKFDRDKFLTACGITPVNVNAHLAGFGCDQDHDHRADTLNCDWRKIKQ